MIYDLRFTIYALRLAVAFVASSGACAIAQTQSADEYFHGGAQRYLTNNIPGALEVVTNGLQRFPEDQKLQKLYELLNQQQQQQQQNQDQRQQDQDKKDEQKQDQKQDQQKQDQKKQDEKKDQQQQSKDDQQRKDDQKKQQEDKDKKEQEKKNQQAKQDKGKPEQKTGEQQPVEARAMTAQEAKQLLDAQKGDEEVLVFKPQNDPKKQEKKLKDW